MAAKRKKNEIFFVRETPDSYVIDWNQTNPVSKREMERRVKESKKTAKVKKAAKYTRSLNNAEAALYGETTKLNFVFQVPAAAAI